MRAFPGTVRRVALAGGTIFSVMFALPADSAAQQRATAEEIAGLQEELLVHLQRISALEQKLQELTGSPAAEGFRGTTSLVESGMSEATVISLLGLPVEIRPGLGRRTLWYDTDPTVPSRGWSVTIDEEDDRVIAINGTATGLRAGG